MTLGSRFLARQAKKNSTGIKANISLGNLKDGILPLLHTLKTIGPRDEVTTIDFDWHNIKDDICPITINVKKGAV